MIDGVVFGEDPRQGYVDDNKFFHPELKFEFPIPTSWKHMNSPQQFQMAPDDGKAIMILRLAQGQDLELAATNFLTENKLQVVEKKSIRLNGLQVVKTIADQPAQVDESTGKQTSEALRFQTNFILYNDLIYQFMGITRLSDYDIYKKHFERSINNFKVLKDKNRINVKPDRIAIKTVNKTGTLKSTLAYYKMSPDRYSELSLINGMELDDTVQKGSLIKIIINQ